MLLSLVLSRVASQGSPWRENSSLAYANSWIESISTKGLRKTSSRGKERIKLSLKRGGISGRTNTITTGCGEISRGNQDLLVLRQSMPCSENWCIRFWRRLRMSHLSNGQTRWKETLRGTIRTSIANITKTKDILQRTVEIYETIWTNWSEKENWNTSYITPVAKGARLARNHGEMPLRDLL